MFSNTEKPGETLRKDVGVPRSIVLSSAQNGDPRVCSANTGRASKDRWTGDDIHSHPADWTENTSPLENSVF